MLRDVLGRRLEKHLATVPTEDRWRQEAEARDRIEAEVARLVAAGFIDDMRFATARVRQALRKGQGQRRILTDLAGKGIGRDMAADAIAEATREESGLATEAAEAIDTGEIVRHAESEAAETLARKRRIGPYRDRPLPDDWTEAMKVRRREAGILARGGFDPDVAREILDRTDTFDDV